MSPASGNSWILQVFNKLQSTSPDRIKDTQKMDTSIDRKLPDDQYSASIFRKLIGCEIYLGSSTDLYLNCRIDFASNIVQTEAPQIVDLGLLAVNTSDELIIQGSPATIIRRPTDGFHWSAPDHVFEKATSVRTSATWSEQYHSYKTDFQIWR